MHLITFRLIAQLDATKASIIGEKKKFKGWMENGHEKEF